MGALVAMVPAGVRCAVAAQQVLMAEAARPHDRGVCLWSEPSGGEATPAEHRVRLSTRSGTEWLGGARPKLVELDREQVWSLPELLEQLLNLPCIIGVAEIAGDLHWMVDAHRLPEVAPGRCTVEKPPGDCRR